MCLKYLRWFQKQANGVCATGLLRMSNEFSRLCKAEVGKNYFLIFLIRMRFFGFPERRKNKAYKTSLCKAYREDKTCPYGEACCFAHGEKELRLPPQVGVPLFHFWT